MSGSSLERRRRTFPVGFERQLHGSHGGNVITHVEDAPRRVVGHGTRRAANVIALP